MRRSGSAPSRPTFAVGANARVKREKLRGRHAAFLLPHSASKTRVNALMGEKDRMRGFGTRRTICYFRTPSPQPSPLWGEGVHCASCCVELSWQTPAFSRRVSAREFFCARAMRVSKRRSHQLRNRFGLKERQGWGLSFGLPFFRFRPVSPINPNKRRKRNAGKRRSPTAASYGCGARPFGARTLDGVPPRLSPEGIIPSQRLSFRPGFLGRGLNGRYPPSPVPVQGSTSHPGHNAGRHDAQAAREQAANPPAGTALAPMTRCASAPRPSSERGL